MPFDLKNTRATMFKAQIGRNIEVYVDDILVKSQKVENHDMN